MNSVKSILVLLTTPFLVISKAGQGLTDIGVPDPEKVGAAIELNYIPFGEDPRPSTGRIRWIQRIVSNHAINGKHGEKENVLDIDPGVPFPYYDGEIGEVYYSTIHPFYDVPARFDVGWSHDWIAQLYLAYETTPKDSTQRTITIYNGIQWGWHNRVAQKKKEPVPVEVCPPNSNSSGMIIAGGSGGGGIGCSPSPTPTPKPSPTPTPKPTPTPTPTPKPSPTPKPKPSPTPKPNSGPKGTWQLVLNDNCSKGVKVQIPGFKKDNPYVGGNTKRAITSAWDGRFMGGDGNVACGPVVIVSKGFNNSNQKGNSKFAPSSSPSPLITPPTNTKNINGVFTNQSTDWWQESNINISSDAIDITNTSSDTIEESERSSINSNLTDSDLANISSKLLNNSEDSSEKNVDLASVSQELLTDSELSTDSNSNEVDLADISSSLLLDPELSPQDDENELDLAGISSSLLLDPELSPSQGNNPTANDDDDAKAAETTPEPTTAFGALLALCGLGALKKLKNRKIK